MTKDVTYKIPKNISEEKLLKDLSDLIKAFMGLKENSKGTTVCVANNHDAYLGTLNSITEFICGQPNQKEVFGNAPYIYDSHQWTFGVNYPNAVDDFAATLKKEGDKNIPGWEIDEMQFSDFESLYKEIEKRGFNVYGIGRTALYDFCLRYGWNHNPKIVPAQFVYVHTKPKRAASWLNKMGVFLKADDKRFKPLPASLFRVHKSELQDWLLDFGMEAKDVEHFLCVCHDEIEAIYNSYSNIQPKTKKIKTRRGCGRC